MDHVFTIDRGDGPQTLGYGSFADADGVNHPANVLDLWSDEELAAIGVTRALAPAADLRAAKVAAVKAEAEARILALMPDWAQRNALALGMELVTTLGPDVSAWPAEDQATYAGVMAAWTAIKAIRAASNAIEAAIPAEDAAAIVAFDVAAQPDWP